MATTLKGMRVFLTPTSFVNTGADVGTASAKVLDENRDRRYAIFMNDSDTTIYLAFGGDAAPNSGVRVPVDGFFEITWNNLITAAVYAVHGGGGTKRLTIVEGT